MKKLFHLLLVLLFCVVFNSCKKTVQNVALPAVFNPSPNYKDGLTLSESFFVALPDNSFIIASKTESYTHLLKSVYLHYDEHFNLIDSSHFDETANFPNALVLGPNVYSAHLQENPLGTNWQLRLFETDYNFKVIQKSMDLMDTLKKGYNGYGYTQLLRLQNGTILFGFPAIFNGQRAPCICALDPTANFKLKWVNDTLYSLGSISGNSLNSMAVDGNDIYVYCSSTDDYYSNILYKLNENGQLIWKKVLAPYGPRKIVVEQNRIVLYGGAIRILDKEGNLLSQAVCPEYNLYPNGNTGYVGLRLAQQRDPNTGAFSQYFAGVALYNSNFELQKMRTFGDGVQNNSVLGKLANGNYVLVMNRFVNNVGEKLLFFKLDQNLNVLTN